MDASTGSEGNTGGGVASDSGADQLDIGRAFSEGLELYKRDFGLLLGGTLLASLVQMGAQTLTSGLGAVAVNGPMEGGRLWLFLKRLRGEPATVGDIFAGFERAFVPLLLAWLVPMLILGGIVLPAAGLLIGGTAVAANDGGGGLLVAGIVAALATLPLVVYFGVSWMFTVPLVIDRRLGFWEAMKLSRATVQRGFWSAFALGLVAALIAGAGVLACGVGLLFTLPIGVAVTACGYEQLFGRPRA